MLANYGLSISAAYVLDESCLQAATAPQRFGGGERPIYFAPIIKSESINKEMGFLKDIKGLVTPKASPLVMDTEKAKEKTGEGLSWLLLRISPGRVLKRGERSNPLLLHPPGPQQPRRRAPSPTVSWREVSRAILRTNPFRERPRRREAGTQAIRRREGERVDLSKVLRAEVTVKEETGRVFAVGPSEILQDNVIDKEGKSRTPSS